jgi:ring-1,2-phenylacetyl-CoA epoxidase subunit PaaE
MDRLNWIVSNKFKETDEAFTFVLKNEQNIPVSYEAGQFLTFIFEHKEDEIRRSYSISSSPPVDENISITVKRTPNGEISRHLIDHVHINDRLVSIQPAGRFIINTSWNFRRQFFFIAAGSGIVPIYSLIKKILKEEPLSKIVLIYQNHNEDDIIFKYQLDEIQNKYSANLKLMHFLSKPETKNHHPQKLNNFLLEKIVEENLIEGNECFFYLCGPVSFMRMAQFTLKWMGFNDEHIKKENFTVDFIPPPPLINDFSKKKIIIHYNKETFRISVAYPVNILQAALDKNIQLPYSCRSGRCASCVAKCLKGKIKMSNNEVLTDKDLKDGLVLTCVGYAETDIELEW